MCTALPPRRSPVTANTAATIHSLLWPTVVLASGPIDDARCALVAPRFAPPARLWARSGMTLPPEDLRRLFLVRGGGFLPRRILALRGPGRSTLPRSSPFLWCPIVLPILRSYSIDFQGSALRLVHTELLRREGRILSAPDSSATLTSSLSLTSLALSSLTSSSAALASSP